MGTLLLRMKIQHYVHKNCEFVVQNGKKQRKRRRILTKIFSRDTPTYVNTYSYQKCTPPSLINLLFSECNSLFLGAIYKGRKYSLVYLESKKYMCSFSLLRDIERFWVHSGTGGREDNLPTDFNTMLNHTSIQVCPNVINKTQM